VVTLISIETRNQLVENLDPITERHAAIPQLQCRNQLLACRHADLPRHLVPLLPDNPTGSKLREATGTPKTIDVSGNVPPPNISGSEDFP
jgi:hypothetical protein